ncbi:MAG: hypothetical protein ACLP1X_19975 [Polyangiaceae bacterium]
MRPNVLFEYDQACKLLGTQLATRFPGIDVHPSPAEVPIYPHYNKRAAGFTQEQGEVSMLVITNRAKTGTLAVVPVAVYEQGEILASCALSGTLAEQIRTDVLEMLALRTGRWVFLGRAPVGPARRFPTLEVESLLANVLGGMQLESKSVSLVPGKRTSVRLGPYGQNARIDISPPDTTGVAVVSYQHGPNLMGEGTVSLEAFTQLGSSRILPAGEVAIIAFLSERTVSLRVAALEA